MLLKQRVSERSFHCADIVWFSFFSKHNFDKYDCHQFFLQTVIDNRITEWLKLEETSMWVLNISREGDSTTSLGNLFQCSVTVTVKKCPLIFSQNFLCFSLYLLPLIFSLGTNEKRLVSSS